VIVVVAMPSNFGPIHDHGNAATRKPTAAVVLCFCFGIRKIHAQRRLSRSRRSPQENAFPCRSYCWLAVVVSFFLWLEAAIIVTVVATIDTRSSVSSAAVEKKRCAVVAFASSIVGCIAISISISSTTKGSFVLRLVVSLVSCAVVVEVSRSCFWDCVFTHCGITDAIIFPLTIGIATSMMKKWKQRRTDDIVAVAIAITIAIVIVVGVPEDAITVVGMMFLNRKNRSLRNGCLSCWRCCGSHRKDSILLIQDPLLHLLVICIAAPSFVAAR
jgi:hypothetical protein